MSCYVGLQALIASDKKQPVLLVCSDHEEVGSVSASGAAGPFLEAVLDRINECLMLKNIDGIQQAKRRLLDKSMLVSVDNAHGVHPNFPEKHDQQHGPILNKGACIKRLMPISDMPAIVKPVL